MKKKLRLLIALLWLCQASLLAQVTVTPEFFTDTDEITITYNATEGTSALADVASVYMHSGVITSSPEGTSWEYVVGNWGANDGLGQMTQVAGSDHLWQITLTPRTYYKVPDDVDIYRLGMVFREGGPCSTCKEGKSDSNSDIFVDLSSGDLSIRLTSPRPNTFYNMDEEITFSATFSEAANYTLNFGDGTSVTGNNATTLSTTHSYTTAGTREISLSISSGGKTATARSSIVIRGSSPTASLPTGTQRGINYHGTDSVTLVLWAPNKSSAFVVGDFNQWTVNSNSQMFRTPDGDHFWITLKGLSEKVAYAYQYLVDESIYIADPFADLILDPDDQWIPDENYPNLKPYPTEAEYATWHYNRVSVLELGQTPYTWQTTDYERPNQENLVIYELLVRDFLGKDMGTYTRLIDTLDYIADLGVNAIELMPIMEFNGNDSWGYNPTFMFAPDKYYGTKDGLKAFIDACHQRGIAVILDMVMNQNDIPAPYLSLYWDGSKPTGDNPFFNQAATHPFNVFFDFNHESRYTQELLDTINAYWLKEYRFDGYRFDLSKGFTQTDYGDDVGAWSSYDAGRVATLKRMADHVWSVDPKAYVILEHFAANNEETELANYGMMLWGNAHGQYKDAAIGFADNKSLDWAYSATRGFDDLHLVSYMESHDEQRQMYDALNFGNSSGSYNIRNEATALDRQKLVATFFFPIPGPKMLWQFGEYGYDVGIDFNGRTGRKPTQWEYLKDPNKQALKGVYETLIRLKTRHPAFAEGTFTWQPDHAYKTWSIDHDSTDFHAFGNFGVTEAKVLPGFPKLGVWYDVFTGDSLIIDRADKQVTLAPGQFHLFADDPIFAEVQNWTSGTMTDFFDRVPTSGPTGLTSIDFDQAWRLYPNPTNGSITLKTHLSQSNKVQIEIFDIFGARKVRYANVLVSQNGHISLDLSTLQSGMYLLLIEDDETKTATRFLKN